MQTIRYIMSGVAGLLLLNSCVKDELYKTPHPDKGRITITADWSIVRQTALYRKNMYYSTPAAKGRHSKHLWTASSATLLCLSPNPIHSSHGTKPRE